MTEDATINRLAFMGAGNIARAIIGGLISSGYPSARMVAADPAPSQLEGLPGDVEGTTDNAAAAARADIIIICVKPGLVARVAADIAAAAKDKLVITVAAGIPIATIKAHLGPAAAVIRCMPNTPALVGIGMTGLYASDNVTEDQKAAGEAILAAVGKTRWFDTEDELNMVTAVSGSGPAYFFFVMEAMEKAAVSLGLSAEASRELVLQTALGAARMAAGSDVSPQTLRERVTSPGGTTQAALECLADAGLAGNFEQAIAAAYRRAVELAATDGS
ncbi:MAG TPA: pyrroline-5-carboxylate reductase [Pseudomonadales bacterium]|nr:pyrroline-5-carboxylate reductase [Pseudomonadales bacterium]